MSRFRIQSLIEKKSTCRQKDSCLLILHDLLLLGQLPPVHEEELSWDQTITLKNSKTHYLIWKFPPSFYLRQSRQVLELWELLFLWGGDQFALTHNQFSIKLWLHEFTLGWIPHSLPVFFCFTRLHKFTSGWDPYQSAQFSPTSLWPHKSVSGSGPSSILYFILQIRNLV